MTQKEVFTPPEAEIIELDQEDIILTSGCGGGEDNTTPEMNI